MRALVLIILIPLLGLPTWPSIERRKHKIVLFDWGA